jgi:hypothetical protein
VAATARNLIAADIHARESESDSLMELDGRAGQAFYCPQTRLGERHPNAASPRTIFSSSERLLSALGKKPRGS